MTNCGLAVVPPVLPIVIEAVPVIVTGLLAVSIIVKLLKVTVEVPEVIDIPPDPERRLTSIIKSSAAAGTPVGSQLAAVIIVVVLVVFQYFTVIMLPAQLL